MIRNTHLDDSEFQIRTIQYHKREEQVFEEEMTKKKEVRKVEMRSEQEKRIKHVQLENVQYKKELLKLMVRVKFQRFGFREAEVEPLIDEQLQKMEGIEEVQGKEMHQVATGIFLQIFSDRMGDRNLLHRFLSHRIREAQEQREDEIPMARNRMIEEVQSQGDPQVRHVIKQGSILCNICYSTANRYCQQECAHTFCLECMKGYLKECLRSDTYFVKCPEYDCQNWVKVEIVKALLSKRDFQRFMHFRQKNQRELNPENKFCSKPDCGQVLQQQQDKLLCLKCKSQYCQVCLQTFHGKDKCDTILKNALEHTFETFDIKKCPTCKSPIEKSDGCNHMTCKKCRSQFCWICMKKYTKHHYRYYNCFGCPGMLFEDPQDIIIERIKQMCLYLLLPAILVILLICYLVVLPVYIIGSFFVNPCIWCTQRQDLCECKLAKTLCCDSDCCGIYFLTWLFLQPRSLLSAIFIAPFKITVLMCSQFCTTFD